MWAWVVTHRNAVAHSGLHVSQYKTLCINSFVHHFLYCVILWTHLCNFQHYKSIFVLGLLFNKSSNSSINSNDDENTKQLLIYDHERNKIQSLNWWPHKVFFGFEYLKQKKCSEYTAKKHLYWNTHYRKTKLRERVLDLGRFYCFSDWLA